MGLDMYLNCKEYLFEEEGEKKAKALSPILKRDLIPNVISYEFIYWRKANAIHRWFVDNVQGGEDDCRSYPVSLENLKELLKVVNEVLNDRSKAKELLPTQEGFFFGSKEYDEYYFKDLKDTKNKLDLLFNNLEDFEGLYFEYHSSW